MSRSFFRWGVKVEWLRNDRNYGNRGGDWHVIFVPSLLEVIELAFPGYAEPERFCRLPNNVARYRLPFYDEKWLVVKGIENGNDHRMSRRGSGGSYRLARFIDCLKKHLGDSRTAGNPFVRCVYKCF